MRSSITLSLSLLTWLILVYVCIISFNSNMIVHVESFQMGIGTRARILARPILRTGYGEHHFHGKATKVQAGCRNEADDCDCGCTRTRTRTHNADSRDDMGEYTYDHEKMNMKQVEESIFDLLESCETMGLSGGDGCKSTHSRRELLAALGIASSTIPFLRGDGTSARAAESVVNSNVNNDRTINTNANGSDNNITPFSSVRKQKFITLSNGLKVLLVNDRRASQSTAALIINGPGQWKDPSDLPGGAHLMEHMVLSYTGDNTYQYFGNGIGGMAAKKRGVDKQDSNLEKWLEEKGGTSNAFTAYHQTCFHLNCPHDVLGGALERFATIFVESNVVDVCRNEKVLAREVRRVDEELDFDIEGGNNLQVQQEYITKDFVNPEHPYSKFSRGSLESLETIPKENGVNVSERLIQFFHRYYLPTQAVLVVVSNQHYGQSSQSQQEGSFSSLERWIYPFSVTLSKREIRRGRTTTIGNSGTSTNSNANVGSIENTNANVGGNFYYPGRFLRGNFNKHLILYRKPRRGDSSSSSAPGEKLVLQWVLNEDYRGGPNNNKRINVTEIAFVLNQILGRRGPGSLYLFLRKRGWIRNGSVLPTQVTVPVNVSGFQILKMEMSLTLEGFLNRSRVVAAVYDSIETLRNPGADTFVISREIMAQYATMAKLFGYVLTPRPPDAVELATDSMNYGVTIVQSGKWYRFPSTEELGGLGLNRMRRAVSSALARMSDPEDALIIVTAGDDAIAYCKNSGQSDPIPPLSSSKWKTEKISGARIYLEDMLQSRSSRLFLEEAILSRIITKEELLPPQFNPLVPTSLRPARIINEDLVPVSEPPNLQQNDYIDDRDRWAVLIPGQNKMPLPRSPPEANCRCVFVFQLLSSRPARANAEQAAYAELWKLTFDEAASDLAELGAPGGLAYEMRFNRYGLRLSFLGLSQTLPSYARRVTQLLVRHQMELLDKNGSSVESNRALAIASANRARDLSAVRKRAVITTLQKATVYNVAFEGVSFLRSCTGGVCFSQGDLTSSETNKLFQNLRDIVENSIGRVEEGEVPAVVPTVEGLIDPPTWKPRNASPCYIAGVSLVSDACGRVPR